jgi:hypothetical protein
VVACADVGVVQQFKQFLLAISLPIPAEMLAISSYPAIIPKIDNPTTTIIVAEIFQNETGNLEFVRSI